MLNDEQINEVMRLSDEVSGAVGELACSTNESETYESIDAARAALEAYLRTIGEPENTFPLNPNGSSKWAHLQKHDGAQAIGVVFRTGSGSVGSLVDGRVVWADWLAYPNGSKSADSEYTDEDMAAVGRALMSAITQYAPKGWSPADCPSEIVGDLHNECEELRSDAERYRKLRDVDAWGEDTAPDGGSAWARLGELHGSEFDAFVDSRAESAIETPAKVSPCAGHAVQQDADLRQIVGIKEAVAGIAEFFEGEYHSGITGIVDASKVRGERVEDECRPEFDHCYVTQGGGGFDGDDFHGTVYFHIGNGEYATVDY